MSPHRFWCPYYMWLFVRVPWTHSSPLCPRMHCFAAWSTAESHWSSSFVTSGSDPTRNIWTPALVPSIPWTSASTVFESGWTRSNTSVFCWGCGWWRNSPWWNFRSTFVISTFFAAWDLCFAVGQPVFSASTTFCGPSWKGWSSCHLWTV